MDVDVVEPGKVRNVVRMLGISFMEVVQTILLFGFDTWVRTACMGWELGGFQHIVAQPLTRNQQRCRQDGIYE